MPDTLNLLFLCTGNSCRSQMAEGWARYLGGRHVRVESAGIEAHGKNPRAIAIMTEAGIDISGQESSIVDQGMLDRAGEDFVHDWQDITGALADALGD